MKNIARVLSAAFAVALPACNISIGPDDPIKLRFEGVVTSGDRPLEGAKVTIESTFFVWTLPVGDASTYASGRYVLTGESRCVKGEPLYVSFGNALMLVASHPDHEQLSNVNINRELFCTKEVQRVDFALRRIVLP